MRGVSFDDDRIARGQRRGGVSARDGKGQRKITGAENHHRAQRMQHGTEIGLGRSARGVGPIDSRHDPRTLFHYFREQAKLATGARGFTLQARFRQSSLLLGALDQFIHGSVNLVGNGTQKLCFFAPRDLAIGCESLMRKASSRIYFVSSSGEEVWRKALAGARIGGAKGCSGVRCGTESDD